MKKFFVILFLTVLFSSWLPFKGESLYGQIITPLKISSDWRNFWDGTNQKKIQNYVAENFGLRNNLIVLRNDISFLLSGKRQPENKRYFLGNGNNLFDDDFYRTYFTQRKNERQRVIDSNITEIIKFSDFFKPFGIPVIVVLAPEKSLTYKEDMPIHYQLAIKRDKAFYVPLRRYEERLEEQGVAVVNAQELSTRFKSSLPIFPPGGIHWTQAGSGIAVNKISEILGENTAFTLSLTGKALNEEEDIRRLQNTSFIQPEKNEKYPVINFTNKNPKNKYYFWVYGDSFSNQLSTSLEKSGLSQDGQSYFIHNRLLDSKTIYTILSKKSVVVLCYTIPNFLSGRIAKDLRLSLENFTSFFCTKGCERDGWIGKNAELMSYKPEYKNTLKIQLVNSMPSVKSFQIEIDDGYKTTFYLKGGQNSLTPPQSRLVKNGESVYVDIPASETGKKITNLTVSVENPISPIALGQSLDRRKLGVFLKFSWVNK